MTAEEELLNQFAEIFGRHDRANSASKNVELALHSSRLCLEKAKVYNEAKTKELLEVELTEMQEYQVIQNPTDYNYRDVENARKVYHGAKYLLEHLKEKASYQSQLKSNDT